MHLAGLFSHFNPEGESALTSQYSMTVSYGGSLLNLIHYSQVDVVGPWSGSRTRTVGGHEASTGTDPRKKAVVLGYGVTTTGLILG